MCGQDGIIHPRYLRRLTQGMRCGEILGQGSGNVGEEIPDDFLLVLVTNLSDRLGFDN